MKEIFRNYKIPIILGGCALIAIIVTIIVISGGFSSSYGLYISSAYGSVNVTSSDNVVSQVNGNLLKKGDVLTVGENSSCTLAYKGKKNSENNYLVIGEGSQVVIMNDFDGKETGELFLKSGTVIANYAGRDKAAFEIRTNDSSITTVDSVVKVSYYTNEFMSYTDVYTFMGNSQVQLYDALGNMVNNAEMQIQKKWGRVVSENGPSFEALNLDINLNELSASDLKTLISIANIIGEGFPYTPAELKAVYDTKSDTDGGISIEEQTETTTTAPPSDTSEDIQTAPPVETTNPPPTVTTLPGQTTTGKKPTSTTTATTTENNSNVYHIVAIVVDGEETLQEVRHGDDAVQPEDPQIDGLTFIGWDGSFENVTEDRTITAMFDEDFGDDDNDNNNSNNNNNDDNNLFHTVTVVIADKSTTIQVPHGGSANLPTTLNIEGYIFRGWDKDFSIITSDITITALLTKMTHTVTFIIENNSFDVEVEHGETALPPYIPVADSNGNPFLRWDKAITNITSDTTVKAVFNAGSYCTVTFNIKDEFYTVVVEKGETVTPPFDPQAKYPDEYFIGWDYSLENITYDIMITAYFA